MTAALQTALLQRPRPWRIVGDSVVEDANGQEVCTVDTQRNLDDDVALALAQLIAGPEAPAREGEAKARQIASSSAEAFQRLMVSTKFDRETRQLWAGAYNDMVAIYSALTARHEPPAEGAA